MLDKSKNFVKITVPSGELSSTTAITLAAADVAKLPSPPFYLTWYNHTDYPDPADDPDVEIIRVTATAATSITVTRAQEGTVAKNHNTYAKTYKLIQGFSSAMFQSLTTNFVSITGGAFDVNLGAYSLTANALSALSISAKGITAIDQMYFYPITAPATGSEGNIYYDADDHALAVRPEATGVKLQIGQENWFRAYNNSGTAIANGRAVYVRGAQGNRPTIGLASTGDVDKAHVVGLATMDIPNNSWGYVTAFGIVNDVNTAAWLAGDELYLVGSSGELGTTQQDLAWSPSIGWVLVSNANIGNILVNAHIPFKFYQLSDVRDSFSGNKADVFAYYDTTTAGAYGFYCSDKRKTGLKLGGLTANAISANSLSATSISSTVYVVETTAGHTGTHVFPGTGATSHTVVVQSGIITSWTEA